MSNQDRLLSDEELRDKIETIVTKDIKQISPVIKPENGGGLKHIDSTILFLSDDISELINTQKRLYAESVIGEDDWHGDKTNLYRRNSIDTVRNNLRAEQRARIN